MRVENSENFLVTGIQEKQAVYPVSGAAAGGSVHHRSLTVNLLLGGRENNLLFVQVFFVSGIHFQFLLRQIPCPCLSVYLADKIRRSLKEKSDLRQRSERQFVKYRKDNPPDIRRIISEVPAVSAAFFPGAGFRGGVPAGKCGMAFRIPSPIIHLRMFL